LPFILFAADIIGARRLSVPFPAPLFNFRCLSPQTQIRSPEGLRHTATTTSIGKGTYP
jgi:hypothetical protein